MEKFKFYLDLNDKLIAIVNLRNGKYKWDNIHNIINEDILLKKSYNIDNSYLFDRYKNLAEITNIVKLYILLKE